jgi:tetratricopeptide (TPR) repeat protein
MTDRRRSPAELAALVGFVVPSTTSALVGRHGPAARVQVEPVASAPTGRCGPVAGTDLDPAGRFEPVSAPRGGAPAATAPDPRSVVEIEVIEVDAGFGEPHYDRVIARLQRARRSALLDLGPAPGIKLGLFDRLVHHWQAPRGAVPRLGILLGFEQWTVLRTVVARRLSALADRDVAIEIGYSQQSDSLRDWVGGGNVRHDRLPEVIAWLRTDWSPGPIWPTVLRGAAHLIQSYAPRHEAPAMLLELSALARSFLGTEAAEQAAEFARAALACIGDQPNRDGCRALRALGVASLSLGHTDAGLALLEAAITTAIVLGDPIEEGSTLAEMGFHALRGGRVARAELRFRTALALVETNGPAHLRAILHHHLALALHQQHKHADEAELHATTALGLRPDPNSQLAREDRALLALIRARRTSPRN